MYFRVGGPHIGKADIALEVNSDNVLIDHTWVWRADHGVEGFTDTERWNTNIGRNGAVINGDHVTATGLFVEHFQQYNTVWNGDDGTTILYQNELPYDPPTQADWMNGGVEGWAGYKVGDRVRTHTLYGAGVYVFNQNNPSIHTENGFEVPETPGRQAAPHHDGQPQRRHRSTTSSTAWATPADTTKIGVSGVRRWTTPCRRSRRSGRARRCASAVTPTLDVAGDRARRGDPAGPGGRLHAGRAHGGLHPRLTGRSPAAGGCQHALRGASRIVMRVENETSEDQYQDATYYGLSVSGVQFLPDCFTIVAGQDPVSPGKRSDVLVGCEVPDDVRGPLVIDVETNDDGHGRIDLQTDAQIGRPAAEAARASSTGRCERSGHLVDAEGPDGGGASRAHPLTAARVASTATYAAAGAPDQSTSLPWRTRAVVWSTANVAPVAARIRRDAGRRAAGRGRPPCPSPPATRPPPGR